MKKMKKVQYAIIGSGVAGLSAAYFLAKKGAKSVYLLEQESRPGLHASGRNAGMIRQVVPDPAVGELARKGASFLRSLPPFWKVSFRPHGSLLLAKGKEKIKLHRSAAFAKRAGLPLQWLSAEQTVRKVSVLKGTDFEEALFCPTDGVIQLHPFLLGYLKEARRLGVKVWMKAKVKKIVSASDGFRIETSKGPLEAEVVVNAAGAWAGIIGQMAKASSIPFRSFRRHLLLSRRIRGVNPKWPFVWHMSDRVYFRPESGGLLFSPCDEDRLRPCLCPVDRRLAWKRLQSRLRVFPSLPEISLRRCMGGLRTFSPDGSFCIGWDGRLENFFWVAGLDGHGMTTGPAIGDFASNLLLRRRADPHLIRAFSPSRFQH